LEGTFRRWHENGQLAEELVLQAGQPEGVARSWFPSGSLKAEVTLKSGQVLTQKFWKDGERVPEPALAQAGKTP
jgi:antitoxin component YwqK of YwqJK toxin-antitoxin module